MGVSIYARRMVSACSTFCTMNRLTVVCVPPTSVTTLLMTTVTPSCTVVRIYPVLALNSTIGVDGVSGWTAENGTAYTYSRETSIGHQGY